MTGAIRKRALLLLAAAAFAWIGVPKAHARLLFTPGDPAFQGATVVPLDESSGFADGQQAHSVTAGGVTVDFRTDAPQGFFGAFFGGIHHFVVLYPDPVVIDFAPGVGAAGVRFLGAECNGIATFEGAVGTEQFATQFGDHDVFIGAADIGDIQRVVLEAGCFASGWGELHFTPGGGPPPTREADLSARKIPRRGLASQADGSVVWDIAVSNTGPDDAEEARSIDFLPFGTNLVGGDPLAVILPGTDDIAQQGVGTLPAGADFPLELEHDIPPFVPGGASEALFNCESRMTNVVLATARSLDANGAGNLDLAVVAFDKASRSGVPEICDNGIDDDGDGAVDCADSDCSGDPACQTGACNNDGVCDPGEDCLSCANDCAGVTSGKPANRYCCGNGVAEGPEGDGSVCDGNY
jgi:uncharacterized repeat protein (TIGR01451 family)